MDSFKDVLEAAQSYCKAQMAEPTYNLYIDGLEPISFEDSSHITLSVRNDFICKQTAIRQAGEYKGKTVAYGIASTAQKFNKDNDGMGSVGLIIGATIGQWINDSGVDPAKFTGPILSPGYGWQGAETRDLKTVFKGTKGNVLVTVSRSIATHGPDIAKLTEATASVARDIRQALTEAQNESADDAADGDVE